MRIASFQRRVRFLFHAWRVTFNPIYIETLHLQYFSPSILCIEHEEEEGEKFIDKKKVEILFFFLENTNLNS